MTLDSAEIRLMLEILREKHDSGYSSEPRIGHLQAKLSVMLEARIMRERAIAYRSNA